MGSQLSPHLCRTVCEGERQDSLCVAVVEEPVLVDVDWRQQPSLKRANQAIDLDDLLDFDYDEVPQSMSLMMNKSRSSTNANANVLQTFDPAFLNGLLELVWPSVTEYAKDVTTNMIEPALRTALGTSLGKLGQSITFDADAFDLGERPAHLTDLKVNMSSHVTELGEMNNIVMRCELQWDAAISINMKIASHSVGINHLSIKGQAIVEYVNMMPRPPLFQGVRIFFINTPHVDASFQGMTSVLNKWSGIRRKILDIMLDQVSDRFVVPNCFCFMLDPLADIFRINTPRPRGILKISVKRAKNLLAKDRPLFGAPSSDPYVTIHCGAMRFKSPVISKTLSPVFDFDVLCPILAPYHQELEIVLYDRDIMSEDDFLGKISFSTHEIMRFGEDAREVYLEDVDGNTGKNGQIWISGLWFPLHASISDAVSLHSEGYIFAGVYGVTHLPLGSAETRWWIECSCTCIMPGWRGKNPQTTPKISTSSASTLASTNKSDKESEAILLMRKIGLLQDRGLSLREMATVLEIEPSTLQQVILVLNGESSSVGKTKTTKGKAAAKKYNEHINLVLGLGHHTLQWDHAFDFLVKSMHEAEMTFHLKSLASSGSESVAGILKVPVRDIFAMDSSAIHTYFFPESDICLRVRLQMRPLGSPDVRA